MFHEVTCEGVTRRFTGVKAPDISEVMFHTFLESVLGDANVEFVTKPARGFVDNTRASAVPIVGARGTPTVTLSIHEIFRHYLSIQFRH